MEQLKDAAAKVWQIATGRLRQQNEKVYEQWFRKLQPLRVECRKGAPVVILGVPDDFFADIVNSTYDDFLEIALKQIDGVTYAYELEPGHLPEEEEAVPVLPFATSAKQEAPSVKEEEFCDELFPRDPSENPAPVAETSAAPEPVPVLPGEGEVSPLPRWNINASTFENFIVGDDNQAAYTAARAVADEPGALYNPLFIYGTNGIGKTHLLQAIGHAVKESSPRKTVRVTSCSDLVNDFYRLLSEHKNLSEFRSSLLEADVLLVDDVHGLAKKVQMQEEFFNVFNTLTSRGKQIVLTCDRQPCEIADIDKRLSTRFESGVICQIGMPEYEARMVILRMWRKNILTGTALGDEILEFLASHISSSVRRLKSAFMTLAFHASLSGRSDLTIEEVEQQLRAQLAEESASRTVTIEEIQRTVAAFFNLTIADILGTKRTRNIAEPRMIAMALSRELTDISSTEVGAAFGRNHATILHAEQQVEHLCAKDENFRRSVTQIRHKLNS